MKDIENLKIYKDIGKNWELRRNKRPQNIEEK